MPEPVMSKTLPVELPKCEKSFYEQRILPVGSYDSSISLIDILDYSRKYFPKQYIQKEGARIPNTCIIAYLSGVRPIVLSEMPQELSEISCRNLVMQPVDRNASWIGIRITDILTAVKVILPDQERDGIMLNFMPPDIRLRIT